MLDTSALLDAATGRTQYLRALMIAAAELGTTLAVPAAAWAEAWALAPQEALASLSLLGDHPQAVHVDLDGDGAGGAHGAQAVGLLARDVHDRGLPWTVRTGHVAAVALERGWPVVTTDPHPVLSVHPDLDVEHLP